MANERIPEDPYRPTFAGDEMRRPAQLDNELQPDPELAEGPASSSRVARSLTLYSHRSYVVWSFGLERRNVTREPSGETSGRAFQLVSS